MNKEVHLYATLQREVASAKIAADLTSIVEADKKVTEAYLEANRLHEKKPPFPLGGDEPKYEEDLGTHSSYQVASSRLSLLNNSSQFVDEFISLEEQLGSSSLEVFTKTLFLKFCDWVTNTERVVPPGGIELSRYSTLEGKSELAKFFSKMLTDVPDDIKKKLVPGDYLFGVIRDALNLKQKGVPPEILEAATKEADSLKHVFAVRAEVLCRLNATDALLPKDRNDRFVRMAKKDALEISLARDLLFKTAFNIKNKDKDAVVLLKKAIDVFDSSIDLTSAASRHSFFFVLQKYRQDIFSVIENLRAAHIKFTINPPKKEKEWTPPKSEEGYLDKIAADAFKPSLTPSKDLPAEKIIRHPASKSVEEDRRRFLRVWEFENAIVSTPTGKRRIFGEDLLDEMESILNRKPTPSLDDFRHAVYNLLKKHNVKYLLAGQAVSSKLAEHKERLAEVLAREEYVRANLPALQKDPAADRGELAKLEREFKTFNNTEHAAYLRNLRDKIADMYAQESNILNFFYNISALYRSWFMEIPQGGTPSPSVPQQGIFFEKAAFKLSPTDI